MHTLYHGERERKRRGKGRHYGTRESGYYLALFFSVSAPWIRPSDGRRYRTRMWYLLYIFPSPGSRHSQRWQRLLKCEVPVDIFSLGLSVGWWCCLGVSEAAGSATRADLISPFMFLISLIGGLRILHFVAGNWWSKESNQQPLLKTLLPYGDVFLCQLFISHVAFRRSTLLAWRPDEQLIYCLCCVNFSAVAVPDSDDNWRSRSVLPSQMA